MIYISTNLYEAKRLPEMFPLLRRLESCQVGVELFPEWQDTAFVDFIQEYGNELAKLQVSLHGPYAATEHSAPQGTDE